jgi:single-stranded DNA-binding protein
MQTIELTGYLGRDREIRSTRTWTREVPGRQVSDDDYEYTVEPQQIEGGGREYTVLSLATHRKTAAGWETDWHRLVAWNTDRGALNTTCLCRKGDKVHVRGRQDEFTTAEGRTIRQIVLDDLRILKPKVPEYS